jgi:hypothetical protein
MGTTERFGARRSAGDAGPAARCSNFEPATWEHRQDLLAIRIGTDIPASDTTLGSPMPSSKGSKDGDIVMGSDWNPGPSDSSGTIVSETNCYSGIQHFRLYIWRITAIPSLPSCLLVFPTHDASSFAPPSLSAQAGAPVVVSDIMLRNLASRSGWSTSMLSTRAKVSFCCR